VTAVLIRRLSAKRTIASLALPLEANRVARELFPAFTSDSL